MAMERLESVLRKSDDYQDQSFADMIGAIRRARGKDISLRTFATFGHEEEVVLNNPILQVKVSYRLKLHEKIALNLARQIEAGNYSYGDILPPIHQLARQFEVSRVTMQSSLRFLQTADYVSLRQGVGTFITYEPPQKPN